MATDLEKLVVQLSADIKGYEREMRKAVGVTNRQARDIENRFRQMNRNLDGIGRGAARSLITPFAGIAAALGGRELIRMTGVWTDLNSRVNLAAGSMEKGSEVMRRVSDMARRTYSDLVQTAEGYLEFSRTLTELGVSTDRQLDFVESLNNALVVSGAKGQTAERVMNALSKAMALGTLQGENLNTVISSGGRVAQALAESMGVAQIELRQLGQEGKIGRREMLGITSQMGKLRVEAAAMPGTIQDGFMLLNNALLEYVGRGDEAIGISARIAEALAMIADNFDTVADSGLKVASVIAGALVGRSLVNLTNAALTGAAALTALARSLAAARNVTAAVAAFAGLGAAAGPAAMVVGGALVASMLAFGRSETEASRAAEKFRERVLRLSQTSEEAAEKLEELGEKSAGLQKLRELEVQSGQAADELSRITENLDEALALIDDYEALGAISKENADELRALAKRSNDASISVDDLVAEINALSDANPDMGNFIQSLGQVMRHVLGIAAGIRDLRNEMGATAPSTLISSGRGSGEAEYWAGRRVTEAFLAEQARLNALSRERQDIERRTAAILKEAAEAGASLTREEAERLAIAQAAADARRSGEGRQGAADRYDDAILKEIAGMEAETAALNSLTDAQIGYGAAVERARKEAEILQILQNKGVQLTPELRAEVSKLADAWQVAAEANEDANNRLERMEQLAANVRSALVNAFDGVFDDPKRALEDLSKQLAMIAVKMQLARMFPAVFGASGFVPLGFSSGGPTPPGPKHKPAGIVHAGENVWSQDDVRRAGGMSAVEALRRSGGRLPGFANGGPVAAPALPRIPSAAMGRASSPSIEIINQTSAPIGEVETQTTRGPSGMEMTRIIMKESAKGTARGMADASMRTRFGVKPTKVRRG